MSEENKTIRLNKVAKEFNVGITTLVEFLAKKGKKIESNPNTKIDKESYKLLSEAFQDEREVKEKAHNINLATPKATPQTIEAEEIHSEAPKASNYDELNVNEIVIKTKTLEYNHQMAKLTKRKELDVKEKNTETQAQKEEKKKLVPKKDNKDKGDETPSLNIIGKIDLSVLNTKTKPDKKSKEELAKQREDKKKAEQKQKKDKQKDNHQKSAKSEGRTTAPKDAKQEHQKNAKQEERRGQKIHKPQTTQNSQSKIPPEKTIKEKEESKENFIETKYVKLSGPKVLSEKIDLSQFEKPKKQATPGIQKPQQSDDASKKNKHKRKRIRTNANGVKQPVNVGTKYASARDKNFKKDDKKSRFNKKKDIKKVEINSEEIEKQIKETLARLSPMGKSKTSKHRREKRQNISQQLEKEALQEQEGKKILKVTEFVTANELATMMNIDVTKIISSCMALGMFVSINQRLDAEAIQLIAEEFGYKTEFVSAEVVEALEEIEESDDEGKLEPRAPIVTVMGHVDHGKTSLLDHIRNTNVIAGEAGGITQHIGAYEVKVKDGKKITFLDTPGHEAFTAMRARGAKITDIAIIVIATDDRVMPQTIEAINHAQAAGVPIIFALNKIDCPGSDPEKIKTELANMNLLVEDWGGKYQSQEISAKKGINVDLLLDKVLLEAEMLDLKGNPNKRAKGTVIESSLDKGRGYIAKLLVQDGSIRQGDVVLAGSTFGRVKAMYNERNQLIKVAGPSSPVLLLGLNGAPGAGDDFNVMENEKEAKDISNRRTQLQREQGLRTQKHITLDEIGRRIAIGDFKQLDLIVKADVDGSVEALSDSLLKLSTPEVQVNVIHKSVGQITESDVLLATASNAIIIGFQVRPSVSARKLAESEQIDIRLYSVIYNAINELKDAIEGMLSPEIEEKIVANLEIRQTFKISKVGTIAGCICLDGKINRNTKVRIIRDGIVAYSGNLASLKRFKDEVKEVVVGQDCGLNIENYNDIKVGDIVEGYEEVEVRRKI